MESSSRDSTREEQRWRTGVPSSLRMTELCSSTAKPPIHPYNFAKGCAAGELWILVEPSYAGSARAHGCSVIRVNHLKEHAG